MSYCLHVLYIFSAEYVYGLENLLVEYMYNNYHLNIYIYRINYTYKFSCLLYPLFKLYIISMKIIIRWLHSIYIYGRYIDGYTPIYI